MLGVQAAALEKARAGEGRNVEHVALETDETMALAGKTTKKLGRGGQRAAAAPRKRKADGLSVATGSPLFCLLSVWKCGHVCCVRPRQGLFLRLADSGLGCTRTLICKHVCQHHTLELHDYAGLV